MSLGRRPYLIWLAIFALLVQVVVPDLAMASSRFAGPGRVDLPEICHVAGSGSQAPVRDRDQGLDHPCPFCIAASCHALGSVPGPVLPPRTRVAPAALVAAGIGVQPRRHFLICVNPRAPPPLPPA